jgi:hypothetical protein
MTQCCVRGVLLAKQPTTRTTTNEHTDEHSIDSHRNEQYMEQSHRSVMCVGNRKNTDNIQSDDLAHLALH